MTWKLGVAAAAIGLVGMLIALTGWHLWQDHAFLHDLRMHTHTITEE